MADTPIHIFLVDDHKIVREGFGLMLFFDPDFEVIGEADSESTLLKLLDEKTPDIIVLDILLSGNSNGIETCKKVKSQFPEIKVLFLTANNDSYYLKHALQAGANGFLTKETGSEEFKTALRILSSGKTYFSASIKDLMPDIINEGLNRSDQEISQREEEVLRLIALGKSQKEIGSQLHISPRTVETHKKNILSKLALNSTADLVRYAIRKGIIPA